MATTTDAYDAAPGDGVCQGVLGFPCSLRAAIQEANAFEELGPGDIILPDVITLPAGTYNLTRSGAGEDSASTGDLDITSDITINGAGSGTTIIDAGDLDRVFHVLSGTVSISGVAIRNGNIGGYGGGIYNSGILTLTNGTFSGNTASHGGGIFNDGTVTLTNSTVSDNTASASGGGIYNDGGTVALANSTVSENTASASGGGIHNSLFGALTLTNSTVSGNTAISGGGIHNHSGTLTLTNSTVSGNTAVSGGGIYNLYVTLTLTNTTVSGNEATSYGGGIYNYFGTVTLTSSTVSDNTASASGGGIYNLGTLTLTNSTVSGNTADSSGGGIYNTQASSTLTLANSTITNNTADGDANGTGDGGGIASDAGAVNLKNTIVAGNFDVSSVIVEADCYGTLTSQGHNIIQTESPYCSITGDATGNVIGQDPNLGLLANNGGPTQTHAILAGSPAIDAGSPDCPPPATDQRGSARKVGPACDIGAFESSFVSTATPSPSPTGTGQTPSPTSTGQTPTSTPTGQNSTATPTAPPLSPTPTATAIAPPTATPDPSPASVTPVPASPTPQGDARVWGDSDCDGEVRSRDTQAILREVLDQPPLSQEAGCPEVGGPAAAGGTTRIWGDWDCSGQVGSRDSQALLREVLSQAVLSQSEPCPDIGAQVSVASSA